MDGKPYSMKADVYSYGMVLYEIFTYNLPYSDSKTFEIPLKKMQSQVGAMYFYPVQCMQRRG